MNASELQNRTKSFSLRVIDLFRKLPRTPEGEIMGRQLLRSATSTAANYRAVCRARSDREFVAKLNIVVEEADETVFWLEMLNDSGTYLIDGAVLQESKEILYIMAASCKSARQNLKNRPPKSTN